MKFQSAHRRTAAGPKGEPDPKGKFWGYGSIASFNRHTHQPHDHAREIMRNIRREALRQDSLVVNAMRG